MDRPPPSRRADYPFFTEIRTRWSDNDMFGHVNNVQYYRFFEAVVVEFFMASRCLDLHADPVIPFAAETCCRFLKPLSFPEVVDGAMRVDHLGRSSVRYGLALFRQGEDEAAADGYWIHVFVERDGGRPAPVPDKARAAFSQILQRDSA